MASRRQNIALVTAVDDEVAASWGLTTLAGSFLVAKLAVRNDGGSPAWDSLPSGWVLAEDADGDVASATKASDRAHVEIYVIEGAAARSGAELFGHDGAAMPVSLKLEEWAPGAGEVLTLDQVAALATDAGGTTARDTGTTDGTAGATLQTGMVAIRNGARTLASIKNGFIEDDNAVAGAADFSGMRVATGTNIEAAAEPAGAATGWTVNNASGSQGTGAIVTILVEEAGGTAHEQPLDDTVALADVLGKAQGKALAETAALTDDFARTAAFDRTVPDTVALADQATLARGVLVADTVDLADASLLGRGLGLADSATPTDALTFARALALTETLALADAASLARGLALAETLSLADAFTLTRGLLLADAIGLADNITTPGGSSLTLQLDDTAALADAAAFTRSLVLADAAALADAVALARMLLLGDALSAEDAWMLARGLHIADLIDLTDEIDTGAAPPNSPGFVALRESGGPAATLSLAAAGAAVATTGAGDVTVEESVE